MEEFAERASERRGRIVCFASAREEQQLKQIAVLEVKQSGCLLIIGSRLVCVEVVRYKTSKQDVSQTLLHFIEQRNLRTIKRLSSFLFKNRFVRCL